MKALVTGGAGFIGRWLVRHLLDEGHDVWVLDNYANGAPGNLEELRHHRGLRELVEGDMQDRPLVDSLFSRGFDVCYHLAASINVQDSIDDPQYTFHNDVTGTFNVLEACRRHGVRMVMTSTCMVYSPSHGAGISEEHPTLPASPYAASKLAGEALTLSYYHAYGLPTVVARPFNTYGPFQKTGGEGGVIAIFTRNALTGQPLHIYGDGTQTRDFLYVEDCARFLALCGTSDAASGQVLNAGTGHDATIRELAGLVAPTPGAIRHVPHIHPQSEIQKLLCNATKAREVLGWEPRITLEEGLARTRAWIASRMDGAALAVGTGRS